MTPTPGRGQHGEDPLQESQRLLTEVLRTTAALDALVTQLVAQTERLQDEAGRPHHPDPREDSR